MRTSRIRALLLLFAAAMALAAVDGFWLEPRVLLFREAHRISLAAPRLRIVHLSDLHVTGDAPLLHDLLRRVAAEQPGLVAISGDLVRDVPDPAEMAHRVGAAAAFIAELRHLLPGTPIYAVQGHSEFQGEVVAALAQAGITWLSNEGRRAGPGRGILLLGVNQQVGVDQLVPNGRFPFRLSRQDGAWVRSARLGPPFRNFYLHYDPAPRSLADDAGPLAWSGYDVLSDVRIDRETAGAGIQLHSRYVLGEDRMIRLRRVSREDDGTGTFCLLFHGSAATGGTADRLDTGVDPVPGRWYRMRLRTRVEPAAVRVWARVWPADQPEPAAWQAWAEDSSPQRSVAGTFGLWAWGGGTVLYRNVEALDAAGRPLASDLANPADPAIATGGATRPTGWREDARGSRLEMALARSPAVPPGTPRVLLAHSPDVALEASQRGIELVLAGHTHGGQVRLPWIGALTTRSFLGVHYDRGLFVFGAPNARGLTYLFVNSGIGTSLLPVRFLCPPSYAVLDLGS
jgi:predicted MPP superfamily phosphohydrolase